MEREPTFILTDADPALIAAVENNYLSSNLKLCGWHTENNIKNRLYGNKKSFFFFKKLIFVELEGIIDPSTGKNIYDLMVNLPYLLNSEEVERTFG